MVEPHVVARARGGRGAAVRRCGRWVRRRGPRRGGAAPRSSDAGAGARGLPGRPDAGADLSRAPTRRRAALQPTCPATPRTCASPSGAPGVTVDDPGRLAAEPAADSQTSGTSSSRVNLMNTYLLRVDLTCGQNACDHRRQGRPASRRSRTSEANRTETVQDLDVTAEPRTTPSRRPTSPVATCRRDHGEVGLLRRAATPTPRRGDRPHRRRRRGCGDLLAGPSTSMRAIERRPPNVPTSRNPRPRATVLDAVGARRRRGPGWRWPRSSLRIWTQSRVLVATRTARSAMTPPPGQSE